MKVTATIFAIEIFVPHVSIAVSRQADDTSLKKDPLGSCVVPLGGRVGVDYIEDGIED